MLPLAVVLSLWVTFASAYLLYADSDHPVRYVLAIAFLCVGWGLRHVLSGKAENECKLEQSRSKLTQSIALGALILGMALVARLGWLDALGDFGERSRGFIAGVVVVFVANTIPKQTGSGRALAMRRAIGWAMVLGGLAYSLAWLLLPLAYANDAAMWAMLPTMVYVMGRFSWFVYQCRSNPSAGAG
jgi:hypothetical protein